MMFRRKKDSEKNDQNVKDRDKKENKTEIKKENKKENKKESRKDNSIDNSDLIEFSAYQRVGVFVDVQNMFYSAKRMHNSKLNFSKLMQRAVRGRQLIRAICYTVDNPDIDQTGFVDMLKRNGYEVKKKELRVRSDGSSKADWDMGMAIDAVTLADKLDIIVLVSGDGDFTDLVYHLRSKGVLIEAISFPGSTNDDLVQSVDLYIPVDDQLLIKSKRR